MKRTCFILLLSTVFILAGCSDKGSEDKAREYLISRGYEVTHSAGEVSRYTLETDMLWGDNPSLLVQQQWMVQEKEPDAYFGKEIAVYAFDTAEHPLMDIYPDADSVSLYVMTAEGKVIGGYSFPNTREQLYGSVYSLDGRTYEEITGKDFKDWAEDWEEKYGK